LGTLKISWSLVFLTAMKERDLFIKPGRNEMHTLFDRSIRCDQIQRKRFAMLESTNNNPSLANDNQATASTFLDEPEFRKGFGDGMEMYLSEIEDYGRPMSLRRACQEIRRDLDPKIRQNGRALCTFYGWSLPSQNYEVGFMAGWVAAHTNALDAATTKPLV
jgi:hypothetical protein